MAAFTTIAAGVGLAATIGSTAMSFANASEQGALAEEAKRAANASMQKARQALEINYQKEQAVKKEPYEAEREASLSAGAEAIQAGAEAGQVASTAGRVQLAQNLEQADIQKREGADMTAIDKSIINENSRLRDVGVQIDLGEAEGANKAARDAAEASARDTAQGFQGVTSAIGQAASFVPLFGQNISAQKSAVGKMSMSNEDFQKFGNVGGKSMGAAGIDGFTNLDLGSVANMSNSQFRQFKRDLTPDQSRMLFQNDQFTNNYNPNPFHYQ